MVTYIMNIEHFEIKKAGKQSLTGQNVILLNL